MILQLQQLPKAQLSAIDDSKDAYIEGGVSTTLDR
jgi:hypothetical protein